MIDRDCRNKLISAIKSYINEEITAFRFDEIIMDEIETEDSTVNAIIALLWYFYDDCRDHKVYLIKRDWDFYHRMILILESNDILSRTHNKIWSIRQLIAAICLAGFLCIAFKTGFGEHLFVIAIPFGIVSIGLSRWKFASIHGRNLEELTLFPFASFSELLQFRRRLRRFGKPALPQRFKSKFDNESKRGKMFFNIQSNVVWLMVSPLVLLCQIFPDTIKKYKVMQMS